MRNAIMPTVVKVMEMVFMPISKREVNMWFTSLPHLPPVTARHIQLIRSVPAWIRKPTPCHCL